MSFFHFAAKDSPRARFFIAAFRLKASTVIHHHAASSWFLTASEVLHYSGWWIGETIERGEIPLSGPWQRVTVREPPVPRNSLEIAIQKTIHWYLRNRYVWKLHRGKDDGRD
jgi:hypothetical protein